MRIGLGSSFLLAIALGGAWVADARADVIDPAEEACSEAGTKCSFEGQDGYCQQTTCSRLDYSNREENGAPGFEEYDCVRCVAGAEPPKDEKAAEPVPQGDGAKQGAVVADGDGEKPAPVSKGNRCAFDPTGTSALSLILGFGLLGLAVRRRRG
ncbi:MAG: MYXO-CTERM sorting domain-containing protein [Myxococcota bacterium]